MTRAVDVAGRELPPNTALGVRNLIINGDMRIAQRSTSVAGVTANGYYTVDRWFSVCSPTSGIGTWTDEQSTDVPAGQGFTHSLKRTCTTADASPASTDIAQILQNIEGQNMVSLKKGTANAESATLSFWVKSNKTGTYTVEWRDSDNNRQICASYIISSADTWEKKTITFAGDTVSPFVYDNSSCGNISFNLAAGSAFTSGTLATSWASRNIANLAVGQTVNLADAVNNYINITGIQLEVGEEATTFEHRPYDMELQRCMRYYELINDSNYNSYGVMSGGTSQFFAGCIDYKTIKRATPTITITGSFLIQGNSNQPGTTGMGTQGIGKRSVYISGTGAGSNVVNGYSYNLLDVNGYIKVDAEL